MPTETDPGLDLQATLELADWRRRIADLYAAVRTLAATDVDSALELWRATRQRLFREHPQSPVPAEQRGTFRARHFPADPSLRFEVAVTTDEARADAPPTAPVGGLAGLGHPGSSLAMDLPVSAGGTMSFSRIGHVLIPFAEGTRTLGVYWMAGYAGGIFLPFRDGTSGTETYAAGRYLLDSAKSADLGGDPERGTLVLDFNFAFQPSCAFDPKWACPLAPPENRLDIPIRAGERLA
jgi:uncharacterized protein (DUF1684 family)